MATGDIAGKIHDATIAAMKAREKERLGVLRMIQAAIKQVEVDKREELDDEGILKVLSSYVRKVKDQVASSRDGGREDLLTQAEQELAIVTEFMPAELSDAELAEVIREAISETGAAGPRDMGKVMKVVMSRAAGRAEGARVSQKVKELLQDGEG
jgi:uncharacterized protein YqeY